jgi:hypothetical protein
MFINSIEPTLSTVTIFYPTLYISSSIDTLVSINQTILSGNQNLEKNNKVIIKTEELPTVNLVETK